MGRQSTKTDPGEVFFTIIFVAVVLALWSPSTMGFLLIPIGAFLLVIWIINRWFLDRTEDEDSEAATWRKRKGLTVLCLVFFATAGALAAVFGNPETYYLWRFLIACVSLAVVLAGSFVLIIWLTELDWRFLSQFFEPNIEPDKTEEIVEKALFETALDKAILEETKREQEERTESAQ